MHTDFAQISISQALHETTNERKTTGREQIRIIDPDTGKVLCSIYSDGKLFEGDALLVTQLLATLNPECKVELTTVFTLLPDPNHKE